jgi:hypothetical protein
MIHRDDFGEVGGTRVKETEVPGRSLHFVYHESHITAQGSNTGRRGRKPATNRMWHSPTNVSEKLELS